MSLRQMLIARILGLQKQDLVFHLDAFLDYWTVSTCLPVVKDYTRESFLLLVDSGDP